jgi:hypothetical protein
MRQLDFKWPGLVSSDNLLMSARLSTIPLTLASTLIGAYYRSSDSAAGATGYLLILAFNIVLATVVTPLFGCFYAKKPFPRATFCSVSGAFTRIVLKFVLPKDGYLLLPFDSPRFENYGGAASTKLPPFVDDAPENVWDPTEEVCQRSFTAISPELIRSRRSSCLLLSFAPFSSSNFVFRGRSSHSQEWSRI